MDFERSLLNGSIGAGYEVSLGHEWSVMRKSNTRSIAICGAPLVGKRELLNQLAKSADSIHLDEKEMTSGE